MVSSSSLIGRNPNSGVSAATTPASSRISRRWSDLSYDLLVSIFARLGSADLIVGVSSVCSSWRAAARNKHCWRVLDLSEWNSVTVRVPVPVTFNQVFNRVLGFVNGGRELIEEVYFPPSSNEQDLLLVADSLPNLLYFSFPGSIINQEEICAAFTKFKCLKGMAVNQVFFLSSEALLLISTNFPDLSELKILGGECFLCKFLVTMVVKFTPKLRKLEMREMEINTTATLMLLDQLQNLEYLDISGYSESGITKEVIEKASRLKVFIWHSNHDLGEFSECSNCGKEDNVGPNCECMFGQRVMEWLTNTNT
ncbi:hypothetical protein LUZ60_001418 [Juncus effusus]|nr:hypothetical protein LUZ60_001418 [Juncus effusus]